MPADGSTASGKPLIELEPEPGQLPAHEPVEELAVLLGAVRRQRFRVGVAHVGQLSGACFDQVEEVPVALFRLLAGSAVVGLQRGLGVIDEARVLALEHVELALDHIDEAPGHLPRLVRLPLLVRTWNVFHGRTFPPSRRTYLERMVRLVAEDGPDVVALQEVPLWALRLLERWSGMNSRWLRTMPALLGPLGRVAAYLDPIRFRSAATGQANVILVHPRYQVGMHRKLILNPDLSWRARLLRWEHRRVCQSLDVKFDLGEVVIGNLHAAPDREHVRRAGEFFADAERCILCGDFNLRRFELAGFSAPIAGLDQILVRGLEFQRPPLPWPDERRQLDGVLLSDHAPVEAVIA